MVVLSPPPPTPPRLCRRIFLLFPGRGVLRRPSLPSSFTLFPPLLMIYSPFFSFVIYSNRILRYTNCCCQMMVLISALGSPRSCGVWFGAGLLGCVVSPKTGRYIRIARFFFERGSKAFVVGLCYVVKLCGALNVVGFC